MKEGQAHSRPTRLSISTIKASTKFHVATLKFPQYIAQNVAAAKQQTKSIRPRGLWGWVRRILRFSGRLTFLLCCQVLLKRPQWNSVQGMVGLAGLGHHLPAVRAVAGFGYPLSAMWTYGLVTKNAFPAHHRSLKFWSLVLPIYLRYKWTQFCVRNKSDEEKSKVWAKRHEWGAQKVYKLCTKLRGFLLKQGQELGSRTDFIPSAWCEVLNRLQDRVPPVPFEQVEETLKECFHVNSASQIFESVELNPLASATIAQVHKAKLDSGVEVVIKAQYKDQRELSRLDLLNMRRLADFLQSHDMSFFDMNSIISEFEAQIPLEFDFELEAQMTTAVRQNLIAAGLCPEEVVVPRIIPDLVAKKVIVMTFIDGCRTDNEFLLRQWNIDRRKVAVTVAKAYGQMMLVDGLLHADPHGGNIVTLQSGKVGFLDFGQTKRVSNSLRKNLCAFYLALCSGNKLHIMYTFGQLGIELDVDSIDEKIMDMIPIYATGMLDTGPLPDNIEINPFSESSPLKTLPVKKFNQELFMVLRTMGLLRSLCGNLGVELSMASVFKSYALKGYRLDQGASVLPTRTFTRTSALQPISPFDHDERDDDSPCVVS